MRQCLSMGKGVKIKILIITAYLPYPLDAGGRVRQYELLKRLAKKHEITLISFINSQKELEYVPLIEEFCFRVETVMQRQRPVVPRSKTLDRLSRLGQIIYTPFTKETTSLVQSFDSPELTSKIDEVMREQDFDLVQVEFTQMAGYLPERCVIPSILIEHDIMFRKCYRFFQASSSPLIKTQTLIDYRKLREFELKACQKYDEIIVMSREDRGFLLKYQPDLNISVIPNGVDADNFKTRRAGTPENIVFIGWMENTPNIDALNYFYHRIFPLIKRKTPQAKLVIIGKGAPQALQALYRDNSINFTGYVDDLRPYLANCAAFIVPLRIASGTRLKILEAMAAGCPIISTSIGAEGLELTDGKNILIADNPKTFASAVVEIMTNIELQKQLGHSAAKLAQDKYDWEIIARLQDNFYFGMVNKNGNRSIQPSVECPIPN